MFKNYLQAIEGIEIYPVIGLIIFFIVFILVVIWVLKIDVDYIRKMEKLPLDSGNNEVSGIARDFQNLTGESNES